MSTRIIGFKPSLCKESDKLLKCETLEKKIVITLNFLLLFIYVEKKLFAPFYEHYKNGGEWNLTFESLYEGEVQKVK